MSYRHPQLVEALRWKYGPLEGVRTLDGVLVAFPSKVWPTDDEQAKLMQDYLLAMNPARPVMDVGIAKSLWTNADMRACV